MRSRRTLTIAAAVGLVMVVITATGVSGRDGAARSATPAAFGQLPVVFEPNVGLAPRQVRYVARAGRLTLELTRSRLVLKLGRDALAFRFSGANAQRVSAEAQLPGASNYLIGSDPRLWRTHVKQFARVRYTRLYRGIDLVVHGRTDARLEYDFHLAPGADPGRIRMTVEGPRALQLAPDGALVIHLRHGDVRQPRPLAWQSGKPVVVSYRLVGNTSVSASGATTGRGRAHRPEGRLRHVLGRQRGGGVCSDGRLRRLRVRDLRYRQQSAAVRRDARPCGRRGRVRRKVDTRRDAH